MASGAIRILPERFEKVGRRAALLAAEPLGIPAVYGLPQLQLGCC